MNALPDELRPPLPQLAVGGSVWVPPSDRRTVISNGQVHGESATPALDLVVERTGPESVMPLILGEYFELPL